MRRSIIIRHASARLPDLSFLLQNKLKGSKLDVWSFHCVFLTPGRLLLNFHLSSSRSPSLRHFHPFALCPPLSSTPPPPPSSLSLPSHSGTSFLPPPPEGMTKCMVEWRREVGPALPKFYFRETRARRSMSAAAAAAAVTAAAQQTLWPVFTVS